MARIGIFLGMLCLLPVAYLVYAWGVCADCASSGYTWYYSLLAIVALPFLIAAYALFSAIAGARATRDNLAEGKPAKAAASGTLTWVAIIVAVPMLIASYKIYNVINPDVEEGRDRLGRICETEGNVTRCRPDPDRRTNILEGRTVGDLD